MKDSSDNKTGDLLKSSGAKRQEAYRKRQQAAGKRQRMVWIHDESWQAGSRLARRARHPARCRKASTACRGSRDGLKAKQNG